jgi:predicted RNA-binding protein Jag
MLDKDDIKIIKEKTEEFFYKTTMDISNIEVNFTSGENEESADNNKKISDVVDLNIKLEEPQILIGENGQTLFEIQRLLRMVLNKTLQKVFYLNLDINGYKNKKAEYLKKLAKDLADESALTKEKKVFPPMPAYERRIIHSELSQRQDVATESCGEGLERHIVITPK